MYIDFVNSVVQLPIGLKGALVETIIQMDGQTVCLCPPPNNMFSKPCIQPCFKIIAFQMNFIHRKLKNISISYLFSY